MPNSLVFHNRGKNISRRSDSSIDMASNNTQLKGSHGMTWHDMAIQYNARHIYLYAYFTYIMALAIPRPIQCDHQTDFRKKNSVSALPTTLLQTGHLAATFVWAACCRKRKAQTKQMTWPHCAVRMSSGSPRGEIQTFQKKKKPRTKENNTTWSCFFFNSKKVVVVVSPCQNKLQKPGSGAETGAEIFCWSSNAKNVSPLHFSIPSPSQFARPRSLSKWDR